MQLAETSESRIATNARPVGERQLSETGREDGQARHR